MGKTIGGVSLLLLGLFMLVGFFNADVDGSAPATAIAVALAVGLPLVSGALVLRSRFGDGSRIAGRKDALRRQTLQAEVLKLAGMSNGKLTVVEVVAKMAITQEMARETLDALMVGGLAEIEVTDAGLIVYSFADVRQLGDKDRARGILDD